jgi:SnoaL-like domain
LSQAGMDTEEQHVSETDYVQLSRLVTEHAWRVDNGRADTIHELYVDDGELTLPHGPVRGRDALRERGRQIVDNAMAHDAAEPI